MTHLVNGEAGQRRQPDVNLQGHLGTGSAVASHGTILFYYSTAKWQWEIIECRRKGIGLN